MQGTFKTYYQLMKPGIIYGNALPAIGAYCLAAGILGIQPASFAGMLIGLSLVIGSGCAINNYIDRDIDRKMARTKKRALAQGTVPGSHALWFAAVIGVVGFTTLYSLTTVEAVVAAAFGFVAYVLLYSLLGKRSSVHGTVIGSLSGATPPVVGYTAVSGTFDGAAILLFLIMVLWQMPHFYAIAMYRRDDYAAAGIPVLAVKKGMAASKRYIVGYITVYLAAAGSLTLAGYTGIVYLAAMTGISGYWLYLGLMGLGNSKNDMAWARKIFGTSLIVLLVWSVLLAVDSLLP